VGQLKVLFDTNILIDHLKGIPAATEEIAQHVGPFISIVTWIEVMSGARTDADMSATRHLLSQFAVFDFDQEIAEECANIRRQLRLRLPDAIILATSRHHHATLITRNTRDFPEKMDGLRVPYRL
jgi:predicted nucleic acid-binding protein